MAQCCGKGHRQPRAGQALPAVTQKHLLGEAFTVKGGQRSMPLSLRTLPGGVVRSGPLGPGGSGHGIVGEIPLQLPSPRPMSFHACSLPPSTKPGPVGGDRTVEGGSLRWPRWWGSHNKPDCEGGDVGSRELPESGPLMPPVLPQPTPPPPPVPPTKQQYLCQPLLDAVLANIRSPVFNHSLYRTFVPAVTAIHGPPITYVQPGLSLAAEGGGPCPPA